jgi:hypothetical protein
LSSQTSRTFFLNVLLAAIFQCLSADPALAQSQKKGDASVRMEYQYIRTGSFLSQGQELDYWSTDSQVAVLSGDYALNESWTVFAALPYVRKRFNSEVPWGGDPHNPNDPYWIDFVPPDKRFWDDENYHGAFQDFSVGVSYRIQKGPWTLYPSISYGVPASDYPFFAKAAIGKNLWTVPVGTSFAYVPYFSDWHFDGSVSYVFSEKPLGVNVDYWLVDLSAGYWFRANLSVEAFLTLKYVRDGISLLSMDFINEDAAFPPIYPDDYDTEAWWQHDRLVGNRILNLGLGIDYFFSREWKLSGSAYQSVWTDESNEVDYAFTLGFTRFFGGD